MKKAVIYTRVSTKDQLAGLSLEVQLERCREYCEKLGFGVDRVFEERGESAKTSDRGQLQEMLSYVRQAIESAGCYPSVEGRGENLRPGEGSLGGGTPRGLKLEKGVVRPKHPYENTHDNDCDEDLEEGVVIHLFLPNTHEGTSAPSGA